jgi:ubiquinone/menaquinone biosynthesis C-methylase UbiE
MKDYDEYKKSQFDISEKNLAEFEQYIKSHIWRFGTYLDWVQPYLKKEYKYLDLGCRNGEFLVQLRERTGAWKLWGVEFHENSAAIASDRGIAIHTVDVHNLDFDNDFFDFVFLTHLLEHTYNPKRVLWQVERVTKPGGKIFIEVPLEPKPNKVPTEWGHWHTFQNPQMLLDLIDTNYLKVLKRTEDPRKKWFKLLVQKEG